MNTVATITISFNGQSVLIPPHSSLLLLLEVVGAPPPPFAIAVNNHFVPRGLYAGTRLRQDDRIDLVVPVEGG